MNIAELTDLELQIDHLIHSIERLKAENLSLRQKMGSSIRERTRLKEQNQNVTVKIKRIIHKLREELS